MLIQHRAFIFNYQRFEDEIEPLIRDAMQGQAEPLAAYCDRNRSLLKWLPTSHDPLDLAQSVLTLCYDPSKDIGLGEQWGEIDRVLKDGDEVVSGVLLGRPLVINGRPYAPDGCVAYFQLEEWTRGNLLLIQRWVVAEPHNQRILQPAIDLFQTVVNANRGLYILFG